MRNRWTEEEIEKLSKLYFNNKNDKEIAILYNTTELNIYKIRVELGLTDNYRLDFNNEDVREYIIKHFNEANSMNQLSKTLKLASQTILRVLREYKKEGYIKTYKIKNF